MPVQHTALHDNNRGSIMAQVRNYRDAGFSTPMEELEWRGLINQSTDKEQLAAVLNGKPMSS